MSGTRWLDIAIVFAYMGVLAAVGLRFSHRQTSTEAFFVGKRSIPSWAMGISMLATLVSSVTFVAYPGSSYAKDWSLLVPGFMVVFVLLIAGSVLIPFYREAVGMSAYEYFERRFGKPTRKYASLMFSLAHFSKMAFVLYLTAITLNSMTGWSLDLIIGGVAFVMVFYSLLGGIEAVIWTDVIQGFVVWAGVAVCLAYLLFLPPGGPQAVFQVAAENHKFSIGDPSLAFTRPTIVVSLIYGFFWYLQRYTADHTVVQRYLVAKSDRGALCGIALGASLCIPVWTVFMLIGTCTWSFFKLTGEQLPAHITKADQVFPYFVATHLPVGMAGIFMAALVGAAVSMLASDLNCISVTGVEDFYRAARPNSTDRERLRAARILVAVVGCVTALAASGLAHTKGGALGMWFAVSAIFSGGLAGLFILAFFSRRANPLGVYCGIGASLAVTVWATLTGPSRRLLDLATWNFTWDDLMIGAVGHAVLIVVGYGVSLAAMGPTQGALAEAPFWTWIRARKTRPFTLIK